MTGNQPSSVLFVCGQNSIRSTMAEMICKTRFRNAVFADSAGIRPGKPDPFVEIILNENGMSKPNHKPKLLQEMDDHFFDLIVALSPRAYEAAKLLAENLHIDIEYWPTDDPSEEVGSRDRVLDSYRTVFNMLEKRVLQRFQP